MGYDFGSSIRKDMFHDKKQKGGSDPKTKDKDEGKDKTKADFKKEADVSRMQMEQKLDKKKAEEEEAKREAQEDLEEEYEDNLTTSSKDAGSSSATEPLPPRKTEVSDGNYSDTRHLKVGGSATTDGDPIRSGQVKEEKKKKKKRSSSKTRKAAPNNIQITGLPIDVINFMRDYLSVTSDNVSRRDLLIIYVAITSGKFTDDDVKGMVSVAAYEAYNKFKKYSPEHQISDELGLTNKKIQQIMHRLDTIELAVAYQVFCELGFRNQRSSSGPMGVNFMEDGVEDLIRRVRTQSNITTKELKEKEDRDFRRDQQGRPL